VQHLIPSVHRVIGMRLIPSVHRVIGRVFDTWCAQGDRQGV